MDVIAQSATAVEPSVRVHVAGCPVDRLSFAQAEEEICRRIDCRVPAHVVFVNAAKAVNYHRDSRLRIAIDGADLLLADGVPVVWAARLLGRPLPGRVNGTDLMERMIKVAAERGYRVFFLGARQAVLDRAVDNLLLRYPKLVVAGRHHGYFAPEEENGLMEEITASGAQLLFLAISTPQKEIWGSENIRRLGPIVCQGVGGSIDVLAGIVPRAPRWMRSAGLEWFFRFLQEPRRMWRRYLETNSIFVWLVLTNLLRRHFGGENERPA